MVIGDEGVFYIKGDWSIDFFYWKCLKMVDMIKVYTFT